jgi:6-phosphogluconolactonase
MLLPTHHWPRRRVGSIVFKIMVEPHLKVVPTPADVAKAAADLIVEFASAAIEKRGTFTLGLAGGSTPKALYELLAKSYADAIRWEKVEIFFGDERCVPPDHPDSNYRMALQAMLDELPIPYEKIHRMKGEIDPNEAAKEYGEMLKARFGDEGLDVLLLGMGDDGHTASLFPGTEALREPKHRCVANFVPKLDTWRITLTAPFINRSEQVLVLVTGGNKAARVAEVLEGEHDPDRLPIQLVNPVAGELSWILDAAAAGMDIDAG